MIGQQTRGMSQKAGFLPRPGWRLKKILAIHVVEEDFFAATATAHGVVNGPVIFNAPWACYGAIVTSLVANVKQNTTLCYGLSPFWPDPFFSHLSPNRSLQARSKRKAQHVI